MTPSLPIPASGQAVAVDQADQPAPFVPRRMAPAEATAEFFAARISNENIRAAYTRTR